MLSLNQPTYNGTLKNHRPSFPKNQVKPNLPRSTQRKTGKMPRSAPNNDSDHICAECGKCFISSSTLETHMRTHEEEDDDVVICLESSEDELVVCDQEFIDTSAMKSLAAKKTDAIVIVDDEIIIDDDVEVEETPQKPTRMTNVPYTKDSELKSQEARDTNSPQVAIIFDITGDKKQELSSVTSHASSSFAALHSAAPLSVTLPSVATSSMPSSSVTKSYVSKSPVSRVSAVASLTNVSVAPSPLASSSVTSQYGAKSVSSLPVALSPVASSMVATPYVARSSMIGSPVSLPTVVTSSVTSQLVPSLSVVSPIVETLSDALQNAASSFVASLPVASSSVTSPYVARSSLVSVATSSVKSSSIASSSVASSPLGNPSVASPYVANSSMTLPYVAKSSVASLNVARTTVVSSPVATSSVTSSSVQLYPIVSPLVASSINPGHTGVRNLSPLNSGVYNQITVGQTLYEIQSFPKTVIPGRQTNVKSESITRAPIRNKQVPKINNQTRMGQSFYEIQTFPGSVLPYNPMLVESVPLSKASTSDVQSSNASTSRDTRAQVYSHMCTSCDREFTDLLSLQCHMETHAVLEHLNFPVRKKEPNVDSYVMPKIVSTCTVGEPEDSKADILLASEPVEDVDDENVYVCDECGKRVKDLRALSKHLETHKKKKKRHRCGQCRRYFKSLPGLKIHMKTHNIGKSSKKLVIPSAPKNPNVIRTAGDDIPKVGKRSNKRVAFRILNSGGHETDETPKPVPDGNSEQPENTDESQTDTASDFEGPRGSDLEEPKDSEKEKVSPTFYSPPLSTGKGNTHICNVCWKTFDDVGALAEHIEMHRETILYKCRYCNREMTNLTAFKLHIRRHTIGKGKYTLNHFKAYPHRKLIHCRYCDKTFWTKSGLNNHMYIHVGKRPYGCPICRRRFIQSSDVRKHLPTHMNTNKRRKPPPPQVKLKVCPECKVRFKFQSDLDKHMQAVHQDKSTYSNCDECVMGFVEPSDLWDHLALHRSVNDQVGTYEPALL